LWYIILNGAALASALILNTRAPDCPFLCSSLLFYFYYFFYRWDNNNISKTRNRPNNTTITVQCSISIGIYSSIYNIIRLRDNMSYRIFYPYFGVRACNHILYYCTSRYIVISGSAFRSSLSDHQDLLQLNNFIFCTCAVIYIEIEYSLRFKIVYWYSSAPIYYIIKNIIITYIIVYLSFSVMRWSLCRHHTR